MSSNLYEGVLRNIDQKFSSDVIDHNAFSQPAYSPQNHYLDVSRKPYFNALLVLRHIFKQASDLYWGIEQGAMNMDLFMMTPSVSSPMGPGSDSEAIKIKFGDLETYLVDSSQFGFEPILMNGVDRVYCYLPSMRGEDPDKRHLNQFYHCEAEIRGTLDDLTPLVEGYIKFVAKTFLAVPNLCNLLSESAEVSKEILTNIVSKEKFDRICFDDAVTLLTENGYKDLIIANEFGRVIPSSGELTLMKLLKCKSPIWLERFDRDTVAFYQKPDPTDTNKVINADLLFPPLLENSFGGEIVGAGQRQDSSLEMLQSLKRQGLVIDSYQWYADLRDQPGYQTTSGFGLGVERFLTWVLGKDDIKNVIFYPRLKNVHTTP